MRILITGSRGYIGAVVVPYLKEKKFNITEIDANWFDVKLNNNSNDIRDKSTYDHISNCDYIIYLAAVSNDPMGMQYGDVTYEINAKSCIDLAKQAKNHGVKKFIFASSCSIYGSASDKPRKETDLLNPLTSYAKSKVLAEEQLKNLSDNNFKVYALRFATACGSSPNLRLDLVFNDFIASAVIEKKILVLSDGSPWRPLIHVNDMARAIYWALQDKNNKRFISVNIGSDAWTYQIKDLANEVLKYIPEASCSINKSASPDKRSYKVDFSLFRELAPEHQPLVKFDEAAIGLINQVNQIKNNIITNYRESIPYIRLKTLNHYIEQGIMDEQLRWKKNE